MSPGDIALTITNHTPAARRRPCPRCRVRVAMRREGPPRSRRPQRDQPQIERSPATPPRTASTRCLRRNVRPTHSLASHATQATNAIAVAVCACFRQRDRRVPAASAPTPPRSPSHRCIDRVEQPRQCASTPAATPASRTCAAWSATVPSRRAPRPSSAAARPPRTTPAVASAARGAQARPPPPSPPRTRASRGPRCAVAAPARFPASPPPYHHAMLQATRNAARRARVRRPPPR